MSTNFNYDSYLHCPCLLYRMNLLVRQLVRVWQQTGALSIVDASKNPRNPNIPNIVLSSSKGLNFDHPAIADVPQNLTVLLDNE